MTLINSCKKCLGKTSYSSILYKRMVIKFFWTIANIVRYVIMVRML